MVVAGNSDGGGWCWGFWCVIGGVVEANDSDRWWRQIVVMVVVAISGWW